MLEKEPYALFELNNYNTHRAPVHLESCPGNDWPGSISSLTSHILSSFIFFFIYLYRQLFMFEYKKK